MRKTKPCYFCHYLTLVITYKKVLVLKGSCNQMCIDLGMSGIINISLVLVLRT